MRVSVCVEVAWVFIWKTDCHVMGSKCERDQNSSIGGDVIRSRLVRL